MGDPICSINSIVSGNKYKSEEPRWHIGSQLAYSTPSMGKPCTWGRSLGNITLGKETGMGQSKISVSLETKLKRIALRSKTEPDFKFDKLMPLFNKANLIDCFHRIDGRKAVGIDQVTKDMYEKNLDINIENLIAKMKQFSYRPLPVREVLIPKANGGMRPLGISIIEDKIIQTMYSLVLGAIYEPLFLDESFGFRPGRSCHMAVKEVSRELYCRRTPVVIDVDLENYFGTISHKKIVELMGEKIDDFSFIRYFVRILKAGVMRGEHFYKTDEGCPQGAICSPVISNIYAHYIIDIWMKKEVIPRCPGTTFVRYADDLTIICSNMNDAVKILDVLPKRLGRYSLKLHPTKTRLIEMDKKKTKDGQKSGTFDFLGFTFYMGKSRKGTVIPKVKTSKKRLKSKLKAVKCWVKRNRNVKLLPLWKRFNMKLRGHVQYYGVSYNQKWVNLFLRLALESFFKWMNRRSQRKSFSWKKFHLFMDMHPIIKARTVHSLF